MYVCNPRMCVCLHYNIHSCACTPYTPIHHTPLYTIQPYTPLYTPIIRAALSTSGSKDDSSSSSYNNSNSSSIRQQLSSCLLRQNVMLEELRANGVEETEMERWVYRGRRRIDWEMVRWFPYSPIPLFPYFPIPLFPYSPHAIFDAHTGGCKRWLQQASICRGKRRRSRSIYGSCRYRGILGRVYSNLNAIQIITMIQLTVTTLPPLQPPLTMMQLPFMVHACAMALHYTLSWWVWCVIGGTGPSRPSSATAEGEGEGGRERGNCGTQGQMMLLRQRSCISGV